MSHVLHVLIRMVAGRAQSAALIALCLWAAWLSRPLAVAIAQAPEAITSDTTNAAATAGFVPAPQALAPAETASAPDTRELEVLRQSVETLTQSVRDLRASLEQATCPSANAAPRANADDEASDNPLRENRWYLGGTFGLSLNSANNTETLLASVAQGTRRKFFVQALVGRVLIDRELALGLALRYDHNRSQRTVETGSGPEERGLTEYRLRAGPSIRQFLALGSHFFVFYQGALLFGYGQSVSRSFSEASSTVTMSDAWSLALNVQPGLMVAATDGLAVEVSFDVLGLTLEHDTRTTDYTRKGDKTAFDLNLDVDLLSLQFAFVGYF